MKIGINFLLWDHEEFRKEQGSRQGARQGRGRGQGGVQGSPGEKKEKFIWKQEKFQKIFWRQKKIAGVKAGVKGQIFLRQTFFGIFLASR